MRLAWALVAVLVSMCCGFVNAADRKDGGDDEREGVVVYSVEHSVTGGSGGDEWWPRGSVELNFPQLLRERGRGGSSGSGDDDVPATAKSDKPSQAVRFEAAELDTTQLNALRSAAKSGGYYRVRLQRSGSGGGSGAVMASVPACALLASGLRDLWTFQSDAYGHVSSVDYATPITTCAGAGAGAGAAGAKDAVKLTPRGRISFGRSGERVRAGRAGVQLPSGPGAPPDAEQAAAQQAAAQKPEEKGFFAKYWMYIVPFALMMLLQGGQAGAADSAGGRAAARERD